MHSPLRTRFKHEHAIAVAVLAWLMVAAACVVAANAWAFGI